MDHEKVIGSEDFFDQGAVTLGRGDECGDDNVAQADEQFCDVGSPAKVFTAV